MRDENLKDGLRVTIIATGFDAPKAADVSTVIDLKNFVTPNFNTSKASSSAQPLEDLEGEMTLKLSDGAVRHSGLSAPPFGQQAVIKTNRDKVPGSRFQFKNLSLAPSTLNLRRGHGRDERLGKAGSVVLGNRDAVAAFGGRGKGWADSYRHACGFRQRLHGFVLPPICGKTPRPFESLLSEYRLPMEAFRWQMQYLKDQGIKPISMDQLKGYWFEGKPLPDKAVLLTFDDGFRSIYEKAYPVVKEFAYPGVLFLYTDFIRSQSDSLRYSEIEEMQKNGFDLESHTKSHLNLGLEGEKRTPGEFSKLVNVELNEPIEFIQDRFEFTLGFWLTPTGFITRKF